MPEWYISTIVFRLKSFRQIFTLFLLISLLTVIPVKAFDRRSLLSIFDVPDRPLTDSVSSAEKETAFLNDLVFNMAGNNFSRARAFVRAPSIMQDGERKEFFAQIMGGEAAAYEWSFETRGKAKTPAMIEFSSPNAATTQVLARWYARTHGGCSAEFTSQYLIKLKVKMHNGSELIERFPLTVEVPHSWGGYVDYPETRGAPSMAFDENRHIWTVTGAGTLERFIKPPVVRALETSQFFHKIKSHEEVHLRQMSDGVFADLFQIESLMKQLYSLSDTNQQRLEQKVFQAIQLWRKSESQTALERLPRAEKEAYAVSDRIEPRFLFNNCERFR